MEFHGPWTDWVLAMLITLLAYFVRDRDKQLRKLGDDLHDHIQNCAHTTPREKELQDLLMETRFDNIEKWISDLHEDVRALKKEEE